MSLGLEWIFDFEAGDEKCLALFRIFINRVRFDVLYEFRYVFHTFSYIGRNSLYYRAIHSC